MPALFNAYKNVEIRLSITDNETYLSLAERAEMANEWGADLMVSIHHNAGGGVGFDVIHSVFIDESLSEELTMLLAEEFKLIG